jgi:hypothetical protein
MFSLLAALGSLAGLGACKAKNSMDEATRRWEDRYYREEFERKEAERRRFSDKYRASQQLTAEAGHKASTLEINGDQIRIRKLIQQEVGIDPNTGMVYHTLIGEYGKIHPRAVVNGFKWAEVKDTAYNFALTNSKFMKWYGAWLQEHGVEYELKSFVHRHQVGNWVTWKGGWGWEPISDLTEFAEVDIGCGRPLDKNVSTPMRGEMFYNWGEGDIITYLQLDGEEDCLPPFCRSDLEEIKKYLNLNSHEDVVEYLKRGDFEKIKVVNPSCEPYSNLVIPNAMIRAKKRNDLSNLPK